LKPGFHKTSKALQKFTYSAQRIDIDDDVQKGLHESILSLKRVLVPDNVVIEEYEAIADDTEKILLYDMKNRELSFSDLLNHQLNGGVDHTVIKDLRELIHEDDPWAYCIEGQSNAIPRFATFTRLNRGSVAVEEGQNLERNILSRKLRTRFSTDTSKLELLKGETITFNKRVDCLYLFDSGEFVVFDKKNFEAIVGLEEEFKNVSQKVVSRLKGFNIIEGFDNVVKELEEDTTIHRRMFKLQDILSEQKLDSKRVAKMEETAKSFGVDLHVKKGKVQIGNRQDLLTVIRLLEDFFVNSPQTGFKYGASVKKRWDSPSTKS
jgi:hypothetical protein